MWFGSVVHRVQSYLSGRWVLAGAFGFFVFDTLRIFSVFVGV